MNNDRPADPQHGGSADGRQHAQQYRHTPDQPAPHCPADSKMTTRRQQQPQIIHFDDQRHGTIHPDSDHSTDQRQGNRLDPHGGLGDGGQRDGHDLG